MKYKYNIYYTYLQVSFDKYEQTFMPIVKMIAAHNSDLVYS